MNILSHAVSIKLKEDKAMNLLRVNICSKMENYNHTTNLALSKSEILTHYE